MARVDVVAVDKKGYVKVLPEALEEHFRVVRDSAPLRR
jgi:hypothetical protein